MNKRIIYPNEIGIAVITPSGVLSVEETAKKMLLICLKIENLEMLGSMILQTVLME